MVFIGGNKHGKCYNFVAIYIEALSAFGGLSINLFKLCFWFVGGMFVFARINPWNSMDWGDICCFWCIFYYQVGKMELNRLYQIGEVIEEELMSCIDVTLNRNSPIFVAHFPGNPILPGACIVDIVKCCAEKILNSSMQIRSVSNLKFLQVINPDEESKLKVTLKFFQKNSSLLCKAIVSSDITTYTKMDLEIVEL